MRRFRFGVGRKLLLTNAAAGLFFIAFSVFVVIKLSSIEHISSSLVSTSADQITENSKTARRLSLAFAEAAALMSNFYENEQLLEEESSHLITEIDSLALGAHSRTLRSSLEDFRRSLVMVFESCRVVNLVLARIRTLEEQIVDEMRAMRMPPDSDQHIPTVAHGDDATENTFLPLDYLSQMLLVSKLRVDLWPEHFSRIVPDKRNTLDLALKDLGARLREYSPPAGFDSSRFGNLKQLFVRYESALADLHRVTRDLKDATLQLAIHQDSILADMALLDENALRTSQEARSRIQTISTSAQILVAFLSVAVLLALVALTQLFRIRHFRRPLDNLRHGIEALRSGNLEHRIDLGRTDEWSLMEDAINHMASELSRSYKAVEDSASFYRGLFELGLLGMAVMDDTGTRWLEVNDRFCELLRYPRNTIMNKQWAEIIHPQDHLTENTRFTALLNGETNGYALDVRFLRGDGTTAYTTLSVKCARAESGRIKAVYILLNDISERVTAQEQLDAVNKNLEQLVEERSRSLLEKTEELETANRRLRELDELKSDFLSSISHELRTPLTSILGFAKLVNRELSRLGTTEFRDPDEFRCRIDRMHANLEIIAREGERLTRLINEILDLSKIESGQVEWRDILCSCRTLALQALEVVTSQFEQKPEVELVLGIRDEDAMVRVDPDRYLQVCINLLNNAIKFTPAGRILVSGQLTSDGYYRFSVKDTGIGIPPDDIERIFDKFHQAPTQNTLRDKPVGTGLGLSICSQIVDHYGGRIWVESTPGMGSTFSFELPYLTTSASENNVGF